MGEGALNDPLMFAGKEAMSKATAGGRSELRPCGWLPSTSNIG